MIVGTFSSKVALAQAAAWDAAQVIRAAIAERGEARIIAATGASQFEFLDALTGMGGIRWDMGIVHGRESRRSMPQAATGRGLVLYARGCASPGDSMTIHQIMHSKQILCIVPGARKASAVKTCFEGDISPMAPASILRRHPNTRIYLDAESASLLSQSVIEAYRA